MMDENTPQLYKCPNCGFPLIIGFNRDNGWKYTDGHWKHECKQETGATEKFLRMVGEIELTS